MIQRSREKPECLIGCRRLAQPALLPRLVFLPLDAMRILFHMHRGWEGGTP
jgi:hypothetical protein